MTRRASALLLAAALLLLGACGGDDDRTAEPDPPAAATRFLDEFVDDDGRVVRRDQGEDTVSEGQAYAMLVAASIGDEGTFDRVWTWTREHLQQPSGLLAWRWRDGKVVDRQPAADADLDAANALMLAAERFDGRDELAREADRIADAVLERETVATPAGPLLVAGPWARERAVVNPSYLDPAAFERIGQPEGPWIRAIAASRRVIGELLDQHALVPDWALIAGGRAGRATPSGPPDGSTPAQYGYEAVRLPARLAAGCGDAATRRLAARMWPALQDEPGRLPRGLDGKPWGGDSTPGLVAAAGAAAAAGDGQEAEHLLDQANEREQNQPTYFGSALLALARSAWKPTC